MITEIFLEGRRLDISADINSLLQFAIDDVKDFSSRQTTFSKTVVIPGTGNNNQIFGDIFDTSIQNAYDPGLDNIGFNFNAAKSAKCLIFQDNLQTFKGTLRLLEIDIDKHRIEYEVALNGDLTTLNVALSSGYLTDLDFSAYNQIWDETNIVASWDNVPGSGVYFPLADYGTYSILKHDWDFRTCRPALYAKEYIDKMFDEAEFRYESDLFETDRFKRLVIPHNQKVLQSMVSRVLTASISGSHEVLRKNPGLLGTSVMPWDTIIAGGFSYSAGTFTYTQATSLSTVLTWSLDGNRITTGSGSFDINIRRNGIAVATTTIPTFPFGVGWSYAGSVALSIITGDTIDIQFVFQSGTGMVVTVEMVSTLTMTSGTPTLQPVDYNQLITMNDALPQNIRQVDFLVSIVKLFNLYVYEDQFDDRLIKIKPFIDFYSGSTSDVVDWTYKLDRDQVIKIKPMSELNSKLYQFNYKNDSDYWNDLYQKRYNQGYGSYTYDTQFEFTDQINKLELVFAATPLVGYVGEDKVYPTIFKRSGNITGAGEENVDSVIRILQSKKVSGVSPWSLKNAATVLTSVSVYGYAGHFDDPDNPTNDLNFGALKELFFLLAAGLLTNTQFNIYWSAYMGEITDKDSKMVTAKFYLTPRDIFQLNFGHYVYLDGQLFRLNKITDYNASQPATCTVELLKVINTSYAYVTFPPIGDTFYWLSDVGVYFIDSDSSKTLYQ